MEGIRILIDVIVVLAVLNLLLIAFIVLTKAVRSYSESRRNSAIAKMEPELDEYFATGQIPQSLSELETGQEEVLADLIVRRRGLLRGHSREMLQDLAFASGLTRMCELDLRSRNTWRRARAAEISGYVLGPGTHDSLTNLLEDENETVRAVAARALARIGGTESAEALARALDNESELTSLRVAENLQRLGDTAVPSLRVHLLAGQQRAPVLAARILGNLRAYAAREELREAARQPGNLDLRAQAALALGKIGDPDDVAVLLECARDPEWPVRAQAASALGMIGDVSAVEILKRLSADPEWWVRANASRSLANMGPVGEQALVEVLQSPNAAARNRAVATLESEGIARRMVRELVAPGGRGEHARKSIHAMVEVGATRYLRSLVTSLPAGSNRGALEEMLYGTRPGNDHTHC